MEVERRRAQKWILIKTRCKQFHNMVYVGSSPLMNIKEHIACILLKEIVPIGDLLTYGGLGSGGFFYNYQELFLSGSISAGITP